MNRIILSLSTIILLTPCGVNKLEQTTDGESGSTKKSEIHYNQEKYLINIKQLTFGGDNAIINLRKLKDENNISLQTN